VGGRRRNPSQAKRASAAVAGSTRMFEVPTPPRFFEVEQQRRRSAAAGSGQLNGFGTVGPHGRPLRPALLVNNQRRASHHHAQAHVTCWGIRARCRHRKFEARYDLARPRRRWRRDLRPPAGPAGSGSGRQLSPNPRAVSFPVGASWKPGTRVPPKAHGRMGWHRGRRMGGVAPGLPAAADEPSRLFC
jgi:hypothetical protein